VPNQEAIDDPMPSDEAILSRLHNTYIHAKALSAENSIRISYVLFSAIHIIFQIQPGIGHRIPSGVITTL
jgi:hypothetical protein